MSESVTVERGVRDRFGPQNEQLPVRQNESDLFERGHEKKNRYFVITFILVLIFWLK
jgi:hypothetical protein